MKSTQLLIGLLIGASFLACAPSPKQIKEAIEKDPSIVYVAIEKDPKGFFDTVKKAQEGYAKRAQEDMMAEEQKSAMRNSIIH